MYCFCSHGHEGGLRLYGFVLIFTTDCRASALVVLLMHCSGVACPSVNNSLNLAYQ